jgi:hypothetical protein
MNPSPQRDAQDWRNPAGLRTGFRRPPGRNIATIRRGSGEIPPREGPDRQTTIIEFDPNAHLGRQGSTDVMLRARIGGQAFDKGLTVDLLTVRLRTVASAKEAQKRTWSVTARPITSWLRPKHQNRRGLDLSGG